MSEQDDDAWVELFGDDEDAFEWGWLGPDGRWHSGRGAEAFMIERDRVWTAHERAVERFEAGLAWASRPVNLDVERMRAVEREAADPLGLDDLRDGVWQENRSLLVAFHDGGELRVEWRDGGLYLNGVLVIDMAPLIELFEGLWDRFSALVSSPAWEQMISLARQLQAIEPGAAEPSQRRSHGHASMCPKHGETTGGLCRRCARGRR